MNWFDNLIANLINAPANGLQAILNHTVLTNTTNNAMGNVILSGFFPSFKVPMWGAGNFSDLMDSKATASLAPFATAFWVFGWAFFLVSIYLMAIQVSGASTSTTQRERLKNGAVGLIITAIFLWVGPHFAVLITQLFYYPSYYFLTLTPLMKWTALNTSGGQAILNSVVNFLQALLSLVVWIVYEFRRVFLFVWIVFFPLAMAFYANDKTRNVTKMWWTEWVYQMAIPLGHALVFGIASAIASPVQGTALTLADIFTALAGTVGLLASAVYVRKVVEAIAQNFGASMVGFNGGARLGQLSSLAGAAVAGDVGGKLAVKGATGLASKPVSLGWKGINAPFKNAARKSIANRPELHAQAIQAGASVDDIMMHQQMAAFGDPIGAGGAGLEVVGKLPQPTQHVTSSRGRTMGGPHIPGLPRGTMSELGETKSRMGNAIANSNIGIIGRDMAHRYRLAGGLTGMAVSKAIPKVGRVAGIVNNKMPNVATSKIASAGANFKARQDLKATRIDDMRTHMRGILQTNQWATRLPHISPLYDRETGEFGGMTAAESSFNSAREDLTKALGASMDISQSKETLSLMRDSWKSGTRINVAQYTSPVQEAYNNAFGAYRPAALDSAAKRAVLRGDLQISKVDPYRANKAKTQSFMQDARGAVLYGR
jgi:hypothetical protein